MDAQQNKNEPETQERKFREPESSEINVSSKKDPKSYRLVAKLILKKFGTVELKSLGNASENVVALADMIARGGFGEYISIQSDIADLDDANNDGTRSGIKFVVKMKRSANFDDLTKDLQ